eukprot:Hpha_TRINITY_DN26104_c0_g1::TRINITY_DN26104_c0_g1_i1::g.155299::m.155299
MCRTEEQPRQGVHDACFSTDEIVSQMKRDGFSIVRVDDRAAALLAKLEGCLGDWWSSSRLEDRRRCESRTVYRLETGSPAWFAGHQVGDGGYREAFRIPTGKDIDDVWPDPGFEAVWRDAAALLQGIADSVLERICREEESEEESEEEEAEHAFRPLDSNPKVCAVCWRLARYCSGASLEGSSGKEDLSVFHALHYANSAAIQAPEQGEGLNVAAHYDESLVIVSPIPRVPGLEVQKAGTEEWELLETRKGIEPWRDVVVFGGRRLETVTEGRIPALYHRVRKGKELRTVVLFEQKYARFYPEPVWDE